MDFNLGRPHISKDPSRGYVEYDSYVELKDGSKIHGRHGIMDINAEIARTAYDKGMLNNQFIRDILKR